MRLLLNLSVTDISFPNSKYPTLDHLAKNGTTSPPRSVAVQAIYMTAIKAQDICRFLSALCPFDHYCHLIHVGLKVSGFYVPDARPA